MPALHPPTTAAADPVAHNLAAQAVVCDIESNCLHVDLGDGQRWYDTRPMLDPREQPDDVIEMTTQALQWADRHAVITRHPAQPWLVRVTAQAQA